MSSIHTIIIVTLLTSISQIECDLISLRSTSSPPSGQDITNKVFKSGENQNIVPAAYGDFNGDKLTDILTIDKDRTTLTLYFANKKAPFMRPGPSWNFTEHGKHKEHFGKINSATMGDFTGDGLMDLMVTTSYPINITVKNATRECYFTNSTGNISTTMQHVQLNVTFTVIGTGLIFCIGNGESFNCSHPQKDFNRFVQEPMVVDLNRDMILDVVGEIWEIHYETVNYTVKDGHWTCDNAPSNLVKVKTVGLSQEGKPVAKLEQDVFSKNFTSFPDLPMAHPSSNAYVDIDGDKIPELVFITFRNQAINGSQHELFRDSYEVVYDSSTQNLKLNQLNRKQLAGSNDEVQVIGQPIFMDWERNANLVHIIPFCANKKCSTQYGLLIEGKDGNFHKIDLGPMKGEWTFIPPLHPSEGFNRTVAIKNETHDAEELFEEMSEFSTNNLENSQENEVDQFYSRSLVLQAGDYNLDGYPDLLAVLESTQNKNRRRKAVIFENVPCSAGTECPFGRTFKESFDFLQEYDNITSASFFDLKENGILDVLLVQEVPTTINDYAIRAFETSPNVDSYFIKAMILSGRPCPKCPEKDVSYGNLIPGALVEYKMKDVEGNDQLSIASQVYRSGYTTLDTPYTIFGIGHSPNFVEQLEFHLGYKFSSHTSRVFSQDSHQIIPNSQIIGIPSYPIEESMDKLSWRVKLFLTPGDAVIQTFGVLIAIITVVGVLAAGLEYKERKFDRKERMAEARRFLM